MGNNKESHNEEGEFGIDLSKIYFTSDTHYGYTNVIRYCDRPYNDSREMERSLIENYNSVVPEDGLCIWVGDCFFCPKSVAKRIMKELNGRKVLIMGNHDKKMTHMLNLGFDFACYQIRLNVAGHSVAVSHYPWQAEYQPDYKYYDRCPTGPEEWLIHGHVHEKWRQNKNMINVGVDSWDYKPVSWYTIEKMITKGEHLFLDRHGRNPYE